MKKRKINILLLLAVVLVAALIGVTGYSQLKSHLALRRAHDLVEQLQQLLPETHKGTWDDRTNMSMPVLQVDQENLCALLEIPAFDVRLPVNSTWKNRDLSSRPCRYHGSIYDGSLIIGGSDRKGQFDFCDRIDTGNVVIVTDMTGAQYTYSVVIVERYGEMNPQILTESEYDLTLYMRTDRKTEYLVVRCDMKGTV